MSRNSVPRGYDTKSSAMKTAGAGGQSEREHVVALVDAAYREGLARAASIARTASSIEDAVRLIEEAMRE